MRCTSREEIARRFLAAYRAGNFPEQIKKKQCRAEMAMGKHRPNGKHPTALQRLAEWELRVAQQKQLIADLTTKKGRTASAKAVLKDYERTLLQLRNYAEVMQELYQPDSNKDAQLRCRSSARKRPGKRCWRIS